MLKVFMSLLTLSTSVTTLTLSVQNINTEDKTSESKSLQYINEDIVIDNTKNNNYEQNPFSGSQDLQLTGPNPKTRYRILMNSNGNKDLPTIKGEETKDYLVGKGKKKSWYNHFIPGLSLDVTKYASNKTEFLKKYKVITFSYLYMVNFWNDWYGWTYEHGKSGPLLTDTATYQLTSENVEKQIWMKEDPRHSNNESAKLVMKQEWDGNILKYSFLLGVWYSWQSGSNVDHAATAAFKGEEYTFTSVPASEYDKPVEIDKVKTYSSYKLNSYPEEISTEAFDKQIKAKSLEENIKKAWFKTSVILVQGYYGSKQVDNTIYIYSIIIRWSPQFGIPTRDSTLLLNGIDLTRMLSSSYSSEGYKLQYENSFGEKQETTASPVDSNFFGIELKGDFHLPIIYV